MDDVGAIGVGGGRDIDTQQYNAHRAPFQRDDVDVEVAVVFDAGGELAQILSQPLAFEVALQKSRCSAC